MSNIGCLVSDVKERAFSIRKRKSAKEAYGTAETYDKNTKKPVLKCSICNGEQVAGFKDLRTGKFSEIMLIRNSKDLDEFLGKYDISPKEVTKEY